MAKRFTLYPAALSGRDRTSDLVGFRVLQMDALQTYIAALAQRTTIEQRPTARDEWIVSLPATANKLVTSGVGLKVVDDKAYHLPRRDDQNQVQHYLRRSGHELPVAGLKAVIMTSETYANRQRLENTDIPPGVLRESHVLSELRVEIDQPDIPRWAPGLDYLLRTLSPVGSSYALGEFPGLIAQISDARRFWAKIAVVAD